MSAYEREILAAAPVVYLPLSGPPSWTCPVCGTVWSENPNDEGIVGCPECGDYPDSDYRPA